MNEEYYFVTFKSTHDVLKFDKEVTLEGYKTIIMPVPRNISFSCGLAVRLGIEDIENIKQLIKEKSISIDNLYLVVNENRKKILKRIK